MRYNLLNTIKKDMLELKSKGVISMEYYEDYYEGNFYGYDSGEWLTEIEETYIISKVTGVANDSKNTQRENNQDEIFTKYKIGLVNKNDISDTSVLDVPSDAYNSSIYKVGKEIKITKKVIARD